MFDWIDSEFGRGVDICVANAGFASAHMLLDGVTHVLVFMHIVNYSCADTL